ncbi:hypothetical protein EV175_006571, partial [Coemansia sp. RSA 1933]
MVKKSLGRRLRQAIGIMTKGLVFPDELDKLYKQVVAGRIDPEKLGGLVPYIQPLVSIFKHYDIKTYPEKHFATFVRLSELFGTIGKRSFCCFPLQ